MDPIAISILGVVGVIIIAPLLCAALFYVNSYLAEQRRAIEKFPVNVLFYIGEYNLDRARKLVEQSRTRHTQQLNLLNEYETEVEARFAKSKATEPSPRPGLVETGKTLLERIEEKVEERERRCAELLQPQQPVLSPEMEARIDAFAECVKATLERIARFPLQCKAVWHAADRNIDRTYVRLCAQVSEAHEASAIAELRHSAIESMCEPVYFRLASVAGNKEAEPDEIAELTNAMVVLRRRNFFIAEALFRIDRVVRRLYVLKLLLSGLPGNLREELNQFRNAVNAVSKYVKMVCNSEEEPAANDLLARIKTLEQRTLMVYIKVAKNKNERHASRARLLKRIDEITAIIQTEIEAETALHKEWNERALGAEIEGKKLVSAVSELRTEQCAVVLTSLQLTHKVLKTVVEALREPTEQIA